jgi:hypothetical protein
MQGKSSSQVEFLKLPFASKGENTVSIRLVDVVPRKVFPNSGHLVKRGCFNLPKRGMLPDLAISLALKKGRPSCWGTCYGLNNVQRG